MTEKTKSRGRWVLAAGIAAIGVVGFITMEEPAQSEGAPAAVTVQGEINESDLGGKVDAMLHAMSRPGPEHYRLEPLAGEWNTTIKLWANSSDQSPTEYTGTSTRTWKLLGRFLEERNENPSSSGTYRGIGFLGFDRATGLYENIWMNNQNSDMYMERGRYDPDSQTIHTSGRFSDPSNGIVVLNRTEITLGNADRHTLTGYSTHNDGREFKAIEVVYTRK